MAEYPSLTDLSADPVDRDTEGTIVDLADEEVDGYLSALGSATARCILRELHDSPTYPADLAEKTDTSLQKVHYHLDRLATAGMVEVVDQVYSSKGREMDVYAPTADPLVIVSSNETERSELVEELSKLLGAVGIVAVLSVTAQLVFERIFYPGGPQPIDGPGQFAMAPVRNVAPPVGLYVFLAGLALIAGWVLVDRSGLGS